ncbi:hypothetical protein GGU11DRAFT_841574 [Lentinula aff. detonsa]|nr:hypothetical protein GGU11DRAFT_841574 [Lentinula aff. detonsa]
MRIIFIFNTLVLSVLVLFSNLAATRPCLSSKLRSFIKETTQKLNLKSNKNFILKNSKMKAQIDYKFKCGSSPKVIDRKPKDLLVRIVLKTAKEQFQFPKQCVLKANHLFKKADMAIKLFYTKIYFENMIQDRSSPHPVKFCRNEMTIEPQLFNNEELNIEGYCYAPTGIQNMNGTELSWNIPWQNWGIRNWPTDNDERILPVQGIASYYASEAGMDLHNGMY